MGTPAACWVYQGGRDGASDEDGSSVNIIWGPRWDTVLRAVAREGGWLLMGGSDRGSPVLPGRLRDRVEFRMEEGVYKLVKEVR